MLMAKEGSNAGVFALVMAVLGLLFPITSFPLGFLGGLICSILGLVFGIIQFRSSRNSWAISAIVISVLGILFNIFIITVVSAAINEIINQYSQLDQSGLLDEVSQLGASQ